MNRASGLLRCRWHSQESSIALHLPVFLNLTEGERSPARTATALPGPQLHALEPAQQAEAPKAALPRKLGRGLAQTAFRGIYAGAQPGSEYRENRFPEVPRQWVSRSTGRWVLQDQ